MDSHIQSLLAKAAKHADQDALNAHGNLPYAMMYAESLEDDTDTLCLLLPAEGQPDHEALIVDQCIDVTYSKGVLAWVGANQHPVQIGSPEDPISDELLAAINRPDGVLTLFINMHDASPQAWAVMRHTAQN